MTVTVERFTGLELAGPDDSVRLKAESMVSDLWGAPATFWAWR